ncbi:MAG: UDP-glucose/GDP-mannose dehydrogenase family protein [Candidatus Omnitrophica bacterium]|nr:UDP-glucose/GDP-mannose dehydrogenase family protein [Candidatus Omnitrophota bacterium]
MDVCVVGTGYVGLVQAACLADLGHCVIGIDHDPEKIRILESGGIPIYEPGLEAIVRRNKKRKHLRFSGQLRDGVERAKIIFICVNTPPLDTGETDLTYVANVSRGIAKYMNGYRLIVSKSTVPVETGRWIEKTVKRFYRGKQPFDVASNPEFLREGSAVHDFFHPERIVLGVDSKRAERLLRELYAKIKTRFVVTDIESAELIKHASNSFLATKISFINSLARVCDSVGADVLQVAEGMGLDSRIGPKFLQSGIGFGGFCFPKDLAAFIHIGEKANVDLKILRAARAINDEQVFYFLDLIRQRLKVLRRKNIAVLGLTFKPNTDDLRYAPSLKLIHALIDRGTRVSVYDPVAMNKARPLLPDQVRFAENTYDAVRNADAMVVCTEWPKIVRTDFGKVKRLMRKPIIFDGRNALPGKLLTDMGFIYTGVGVRGWRENRKNGLLFY